MLLGVAFWNTLPLQGFSYSVFDILCVAYVGSNAVLAFGNFKGVLTAKPLPRDEMGKKQVNLKQTEYMCPTSCLYFLIDV